MTKHITVLIMIAASLAVFGCGKAPSAPGKPDEGVEAAGEESASEEEGTEDWGDEEKAPAMVFGTEAGGDEEKAPAMVSGTETGEDEEKVPAMVSGTETGGNEEKRITDDQAVLAIKDHCHSVNPTLQGIEDEGYQVSWSIESSDENEIVVLFRSYTGAEVRYHIDPVSGETYVTEFVQGITPEEERSEESLNVWDYIK
ncbi:MAG: hypothetical protein K6G42_03445 [Lachnospiraceae bacterium]|nr:hypothetical protein [Lachnospiraceae bacterium]